MVSTVTQIYDIVDGAHRHTFVNAISMHFIRHLLTVTKTSFGIVGLFHLAQGKQCTKKVDCLLSLIGILPREYEAIGVADGDFDYQQPYWAVFLRFVQSVLQIDLDPLSLAGVCRTRNPNLPSWCPDFTSNFNETYSRRRDYRAPPGKPVLDTPLTDQILRCRGFKLGTVLDKVNMERCHMENAAIAGMRARRLCCGNESATIFPKGYLHRQKPYWMTSFRECWFWAKTSFVVIQNISIARNP